MLLDLAVTILQPLGFHVQTFRDPEQALAELAIASPRPAIIITDFAMHKMSGMDFIRECRRINPQQKIILVSGTVREEIYADSNVKPNHFLAKPYQAEALTSLVRSLADNEK